MNDPAKRPLSRRHLLRQTALAGAAAGTSGLLSTDLLGSPEKGTKSNFPRRGARLLFQGDSITDAGRQRKEKRPNHAAALGRGYPFLIASHLLSEHPGHSLEILNRGISGNKVPDLDRRWKEDCLELEPDVLSILIGVNDIWHKLNGKYDGTVESYRDGFLALLERTRQARPEMQLVICEPFVLRCGAVGDSWFPEFTRRREAAREVARKVGATWVPFQEDFDAAIREAPPAYWAHDGVHPSVAGHARMARTWLKAVHA